MGLARILRPAIETLTDLVYPPHCIGCGGRQPSGVWLCEDCGADLPRIRDPKCAVCSHPYDGMLGAFVCPNCKNERQHFDFAIAVMQSKGLVRDLIHRFKYGREVHIRRILGEWLCEALEDPRIREWNDFVLAPIPLHPARKRERRFNQSEALAEWVAQQLQLPMADPLRRKLYTATQTQFDRRMRMRNLRGAFALRHNAVVKDQSFLLVDDVLTTGSTLDECARILLEGGARNVRAITVARG